MVIVKTVMIVTVLVTGGESIIEWPGGFEDCWANAKVFNIQHEGKIDHECSLHVEDTDSGEG